MPDRRTDPSLDDLDRGMLIVAGVLVAAGSLLGLAGFAVSGAAVLAAARKWYRRANLPPDELAKLKWSQAKAAVGAATGAWQETESARHPAARTTGG